MTNPPVLWDIESDPVLAGTKMIAEAWDAAGLYQVGSFIGDSWKEWNGRFRDDARSFFRGENGAVRRVADRLIGSPEIYAHKEREAEQSVNFVTCHDGFTLNDLVSYNHKHNDTNGECNRDGADDNRSWNCGVEGPTDDPAVEKLRNRQVKNLMTFTMLSLGMPMILMGDEVRRTQLGNNNAYCHDNEIGWLDWTLVDKHRGRPSVCEASDPAATPPGRGTGTGAQKPQPAASPGEQGLARGEAESTGLERLVAQPGIDCRDAKGQAARPPDPQRLLGTAGIRASTARQWFRRSMAAMDRHFARLAAGHRRNPPRACRAAHDLSGRAAVRRSPVCQPAGTGRRVSEPVVA